MPTTNAAMDVVSVACQTGVDVALTMPANVIAVRIRVDGGDVTLKDAAGDAYPIADGEDLPVQDRNLDGRTLVFRGATGVTVYGLCWLGRAS